MLLIAFNHDEVEEKDEDCLIELKSWISESKKVMEMPDELYDESIKINLLPKRQFKIKTETANAYLNNCMFFDLYDGKIAIFVEKITFYN